MLLHKNGSRVGRTGIKQVMYKPEKIFRILDMNVKKGNRNSNLRSYVYGSYMDTGQKYSRR